MFKPLRKRLLYLVKAVSDPAPGAATRVVAEVYFALPGSVE
jgi:hypothetical protein